MTASISWPLSVEDEEESVEEWWLAGLTRERPTSMNSPGLEAGP